MIAALSISFFLAVMALVVGTGYWIAMRAPAPLAVMPEGSTADMQSSAALPDDAPQWLEALYRLGAAFAPKKEGGSQARARLVAAGFREDWIPVVLHGAQLALTVGLPALTVLAMLYLGQDLFTIFVWILLMGYVGTRLPDWFVERRAKKRAEKVKLGLPDVLDLLVISIESGLSLDSAILSTAEDLELVHPVLTDELNFFQYEVRAGAGRAEALRNLGKRVGDPDMRKLTSLLIQADRFGTSVSKVLRTQARYMRLRRRQGAEEKAHKVGVKLVFPIFFLIMPSMFLVTAGPALLQLFSGIGRLSGTAP
ncbi:MAG: type II secretion system F family protein [Acidobacteria bacterium]|nr:type II secretion system F family protein [Acidobacteriota bacterium]